MCIYSNFIYWSVKLALNQRLQSQLTANSNNPPGTTITKMEIIAGWAAHVINLIRVNMVPNTMNQNIFIKNSYWWTTSEHIEIWLQKLWRTSWESRLSYSFPCPHFKAVVINILPLAPKIYVRHVLTSTAHIHDHYVWAFILCLTC